MTADNQPTQFSHVYQRYGSSAIRTVSANVEFGEVLVQFDNEDSYVLNLSENPAAQVEEMRREVVNTDHALALQMERKEWLAISR